MPCMSLVIYNWGEPERAPHKRYSNARNIWYMYICIYICMVRPSSARRFIDSVRTGQGRPHGIFCADQRHPGAASGPHGIFCAEKSALKKNCDSMQYVHLCQSIYHRFKTLLQCACSTHHNNTPDVISVSMRMRILVISL